MGVEPGYAQQHFGEAERRGRLRLLVSPDGSDGSLSARQDARLYGTLLDTGKTVEHQLTDNRRAWVQIARGTVDVNDEVLSEGDGARIENESVVRIQSQGDAEVLFFDLP